MLDVPPRDPRTPAPVFGTVFRRVSDFASGKHPAWVCVSRGWRPSDWRAPTTRKLGLRVMRSGWFTRRLSNGRRGRWAQLEAAGSDSCRLRETTPPTLTAKDVALPVGGIRGAVAPRVRDMRQATGLERPARHRKESESAALTLSSARSPIPVRRHHPREPDRALRALQAHAPESPGPTGIRHRTPVGGASDPVSKPSQSRLSQRIAHGLPPLQDLTGGGCGDRAGLVNAGMRLKPDPQGLGDHRRRKWPRISEIN